MLSSDTVTALDVVVIAFYLAAVIAVNRYWAGRVDVSGWLTSKNSIGLGFLVFTVVSTNVGAGTIVGTAGATLHSGVGLGLTYGVGVMIGFWVMAALTARIRALAPAGERSSFSAFFRQRYSPAVGVAVGLVIAVLYFFYLAAQFKALGGILEVWGGWDARVAGVAAAVLVIWMTAGAGIRSDMYTDALHFWAMVCTIMGGVIVEVVRHHGFDGIVDTLRAQGRWDALVNPYTFAGPAFVWVGIGTGALLGLPAMENWQRVDAATDTRAAQRAFLWSGVLNALFFAGAVTLGLVAAATLPADTPSNHVLYRLIQRVAAAGARRPGDCRHVRRHHVDRQYDADGGRVRSAHGAPLRRSRRCGEGVRCAADDTMADLGRGYCRPGDRLRPAADHQPHSGGAVGIGLAAAGDRWRVVLEARHQRRRVVEHPRQLPIERRDLVHARLAGHGVDACPRRRHRDVHRRLTDRLAAHGGDDDRA